MSETVAMTHAPAQAGTIQRQEFGAQQLARTAELATSAAAAQAQAAIEARYVMALRRPRDWDEVRVRILREVERPGFAESAWYRKPIGQGVEGLSVRFAEAAARCMGNVMMEAPVLYDDEDRRVVRVVVSDLEANLTYTKEISLEKVVERKTLKRGQVAISARTNSANETTYLVRATEDDLLAKEAAQVSKAFRTGILRVLPGDVQDAARARIKAILAGAAAKDPDGQRRQVADAFASINVSPAELRRYLGHDLATCSPAELVDLRGVFASVRGGEATWSEIMAGRVGEDATEAKADPLAEQLRGQRDVKPENAAPAKAEPATAPQDDEQALREEARARELAEAGRQPGDEGPDEPVLRPQEQPAAQRDPRAAMRARRG